MVKHGETIALVMIQSPRQKQNGKWEKGIAVQRNPPSSQLLPPVLHRQSAPSGAQGLFELRIQTGGLGRSFPQPACVRGGYARRPSVRATASSAATSSSSMASLSAA